MPRPRTPLGKAKLTGAAAHDPQRYRNRKEPASPPLGKPPAWLSSDASKAWRKFAAEWPWLTRSDEAALVPLCMMRAKIEGPEADGLGAGYFKEYRMQLSSFGGNPTTKGKVQHGEDPEEDDPFAGLEAPRQ